MSHVTSDLGSRIKQAREAKHLSKGKLAKMVGVDRKTVTQWEDHGQLPTKAQARNGLHTVLGLTPEDLGHQPATLMSQVFARLDELQEQLSAVQATQKRLAARVRDLEERSAS